MILWQHWRGKCYVAPEKVVHTQHLMCKILNESTRKQTDLNLMSKYLYTLGQIVVPALASKSLFAATSQVCSPSHSPLIWALICVSCSWHIVLDGMLGCTQMEGSLRPYIVSTTVISSKMLGHDTNAFWPSHTMRLCWKQIKSDKSMAEVTLYYFIVYQSFLDWITSRRKAQEASSKLCYFLFPWLSKISEL